MGRVGTNSLTMQTNSREPVCLFLHVPKTAGTTLRDCIYFNYAMPGEGNGESFHDGIYYFPAGIQRPRRQQLVPKVRAMLGREDLRAVTGHFSYGIHEAVPQPFFYITFLREPVDRVVSLYHHILGEKHEIHHDLFVSHGVTLEEFVCDLEWPEVDNDQTRRIAGEDPEFGRCTTHTLARAKRNLRDHFAFVGITERFDESLAGLGRVLGWNHLSYVPALVNDKRPRREALSPETVEMIAAHNEYDLELYAYAQGLLDERIEALGDSFADGVAARAYG